MDDNMLPAASNVSESLSDELTIVEETRMEITEALVLVGFPTIGLVSSIVANHVIKQLDLKRIGYISSRFFIPTAVVIDGVPNPPVRIYGGDHVCGPEKKCQQVIVITSEFTPPPDTMDALADCILEWSARKRSSTIISLEGINTPSDTAQTEPSIFGVGSTLEARHMLKDFGVEQMSDGMVGGLSGVLLHKGSVSRRNVISLLAETPANYPGARSAARTIEVLDHMLPLIKLDPKPLYKKATEIENAIKDALSKSRPQGELGFSENNPAYS